jgi:hypothetical protein
MHEINTAAEAITSAADSDANIIFGATIDDKLEGEIIITVVATGFDASYFADRMNSVSSRDETSPTTPAKADEKDMKGLDVSLQDHELSAEDDFTSDKSMPANIWTLDDQQAPDNSDDSDLLSQAAADHTSDANDGDQGGALSLAADDADDELEKPSFLRRLTKRHKEEDKDNPDQFRTK